MFPIKIRVSLKIKGFPKIRESLICAYGPLLFDFVSFTFSEVNSLNWYIFDNFENIICNILIYNVIQIVQTQGVCYIYVNATPVILIAISGVSEVRAYAPASRPHML